MPAYSELYLNDAMYILGGMFDYAVNFCEQDSEEFFSRFLASKVSSLIACGNPRYVGGLSGSEEALMVLEDTGLRMKNAPEYIRDDASPEFWAGWVLAYYQWHSGRSFGALASDGIDIAALLRLYHPLHEADITKFVAVADEICSRNAVNPLRRARLNIGITQKELSDASGISLRMIRAYEQGSQDIKKAEAITVVNLASALGISVQTLIGL